MVLSQAGDGCRTRDGKRRLVFQIAVPVFPSHEFRLGSIYWRADRGVDKPGELRGKRVGVPECRPDCSTQPVSRDIRIEATLTVECSEIRGVLHFAGYDIAVDNADCSNMTDSVLKDVEVPVRESDNSLVWSDARLLGFTPMDDVHKEFYEVALRLVTCTDASALAAIEEFEKHAVSHFEQEDEWMRTTNFPPRDCHIEEHEAVLKSVRDVKAAVEAGQAGCAMVHDIGMHLYNWFPGHADYLDSALAAWMTKQTMGGKPVVLRRTI